MSGSRDKSYRKLIHDIKETLRIHFQGIESHSLDLGLFSFGTFYPLTPSFEIYGGVFTVSNVACHAVDLVNKTTSIAADLAMKAHANTGSMQIETPPVILPSLAMFPPPQPKSLALLSEKPTLYQCPITGFHPHLPNRIRPSELKFKKPKTPQKLVAAKIKSPVTYGYRAAIKARALVLSASKRNLPIYRKPIPAHRFSRAHRELFREKLAKQSGLPANEIHLVNVYDRIYLGVYQSWSQTDDGLLLCTPKPLSTLTSSTKDSLSGYLVIGKSPRKPGNILQTIVTAKELLDASE